MSETKNQKRLNIYKQLEGEARQDYFDLHGDNPELLAQMIEQDHEAATEKAALDAQNESDWKAYNFELEQQEKVAGEILDTGRELLQSHPYIKEEGGALVGEYAGLYRDEEITYRLVQTFPRGEHPDLTIEIPYTQPQTFDVEEEMAKDENGYRENELIKMNVAQRMKEGTPDLVVAGEVFVFDRRHVAYPGKAEGSHYFVIDFEGRETDSLSYKRWLEAEQKRLRYTVHLPDLPTFYGGTLDRTVVSSRESRKLLKMIKDGTPVEPEG